MIQLRLLFEPLLNWLNRRPLGWSIALGAIVGLGTSAITVFGIGGMFVCMLVLGTVVWAAKDVGPVWVGDRPEVETLTEPEVVPVFVEPLEMVELGGGTFRMGSPDSDNDASDSEKSQHKVTVSAFAMSRYPVTRELYRRLVDSTPEPWQRGSDDDLLPANYMTWFDAVAFCNALSQHVGLQPCYHIEGNQVEWDADADGYRLPTEAEWEYACRAGTSTKWFFGNDPAALDRYAWYSANSDFRAHAVGEKEPNPWGLYDMIGNVLEWCWDWYGSYTNKPLVDPTGPSDGTSRVLRAGWSDFVPVYLRSAFRFRLVPEFAGEFIGFRSVRRPRRQL